MKRHWVLLVGVCALAVTLFAQAPAGEAPAPKVSFNRILKANSEPENWLTYSGTYMSQRYSLLKQIDANNVKDLELKWTFRSTTVDKHEATPIVVNGVMYTIQNPNDVVALDAVTGKTIWTFSYTPHERARNCCGKLSRGVAVLDDTVFLASFDAHMIAIDARTGKQLWNTQAADPVDGYAFTHAPLVIKDKVIAGTAGGEYGVRGFIAAWDVKTGKEVWRFNTVPGPGEAGHDSWSGDSWMHGGGPIWVTGSYDPDLNLTYWGVGNPGPDWDGRTRLGDNLYTCSVIALDPDTGKLKWHYQFSPHNEFDWDSTQVPVLVDSDWQGRSRKLMLWANRNGLTYVLDRATGEFLKGGPFVKVNWTTGFDPKGRPIMAPGMVPTVEGILVYPGNQGATNWYNPSYSPRTGLFYIPTWVNSSQTYKIGVTPPDFHAGESFAGVFPANGARGEDTYAAVRAIDPKTGDKKWDFRQNGPSTDAGILTTASDLLFSGGRDGAFYALDARDGTKLWEVLLVPSTATVTAPLPPGTAPAGAAPGRGNNFVAQGPPQRGPGGRGGPGAGAGAGGAGPRGRGGVSPSVASGPMTYSVNGKQYVTITAANVMYTFGLK